MTEEEFDKKWGPTYKNHVSQRHDEPSPETRERLSSLETNQTTIMNYLEDNKQEHKELKDTLLDINRMVIELPEKIFEKADERYASKDYERILRWLGIFIGAGVLGYIGTLIIRVIERL